MMRVGVVRSLPGAIAWSSAIALAMSFFIPAETTRAGSITFVELAAPLSRRLAPEEWLVVVLLLVGTGVAIMSLLTEGLEPGMRSSGGWSAFVGFLIALVGELFWTVDFVNGPQTRSLAGALGPGVWIGSVAAWFGLAASLFIALTNERRRAPNQAPLPRFPAAGIYSPAAELSPLEPPGTVDGGVGTSEPFPDPGAGWIPTGAARLSYHENGEPWNIVVAPGDRLLLGSDETADVRLADPRVSPRHAILEWADGRWFVTDLTAANPTEVEDPAGRVHRVYGSLAVVSGRIVLGDVTLMLHKGLAVAR